jgi:hypothetical protein
MNIFGVFGLLLLALMLASFNSEVIVSFLISCSWKGGLALMVWVLIKGIAKEFSEEG